MRSLGPKITPCEAAEGSICRSRTRVILAAFHPEEDMSQEAVAVLLDRWTNEPGFKDAFLANPHGTIVSHGISLTAEEEEAVKRMDWAGSDEELAQRVSKVRPTAS